VLDIYLFLICLAVRISAGALPRGLHMLNLSRNNISTVEGLHELTRLRVLDLSYNQIFRIGHGMLYAGFLFDGCIFPIRSLFRITVEIFSH
jgi:hypothetical protein